MGSLTLEEKTVTTTSKSTLITSSGKEKSFRSVWIFVIISVLIIAVIAVVLFLIKYIRKRLCDSEQPNRRHKEAVFSNIENVEGDAKYAYYESEPSIEIEDDENTCLIPRKVEDIEYQTSGQTLSQRFSQSESAVNKARLRASTKSMIQRFTKVRSEPVAFNSG